MCVSVCVCVHVCLPLCGVWGSSRSRNRSQTTRKGKEWQIKQCGEGVKRAKGAGNGAQNPEPDVRYIKNRKKRQIYPDIYCCCCWLCGIELSAPESAFCNPISWAEFDDTVSQIVNESPQNILSALCCSPSSSSLVCLLRVCGRRRRNTKVFSAFGFINMRDCKGQTAWLELCCSIVDGGRGMGMKKGKGGVGYTLKM